MMEDGCDAEADVDMMVTNANRNPKAGAKPNVSLRRSYVTKVHMRHGKLL